MYIDSPHIREWIDTGQAVKIDSKLCEEFNAYLLSLTWLPTRLDWRDMAGEVVDCESKTDEEIVNIARELPIGRHGHVLLFYAPGEPGLLCDFSTAMGNIDLLYWKAGGSPRYFCGADVINEKVVIAPKDFAEYDGVRLITFKLDVPR